MAVTRRSSMGAGAKASAPFYASLSLPDLVCILWFGLDAFTHLVIEGSYLAIALGDTALKSKNPFAMIWREYGKADKRWAVRDAGIISLEALTVLVAGPAAALCAYAIIKKAAWRHPLQALLSLAELYGGWMTFAPEWVDKSPNLVTSNPLYLWIYLFFMNFVWVIIPGILLVDSWRIMVAACDKAKVGTTKKGSSSIPVVWYHVVLGTLALYAVLVPFICGLIAIGKL